MSPSLTVLTMLVAAPVSVAAPVPCPDTPTELCQVAPDKSDKPWVVPATPSEKTRAVVLLHGLYIHPIWPGRATQPWRRLWQEPNSPLVKALAPDADVFAFAYAQMTTVDDVARGAGLRDAVARLRKAGYKEVVLVGHSAGGVLAKLFAEQNPEAGVTKVVTVSAPFAGVESAGYGIGYRKVQAPFVESLAPAARIAATRANPHPLGKGVEAVSVVCKLPALDTDGLVAVPSQWPDDLQQLGIPAVLVTTNHFTVMYEPAAAKQIAELVREKLTRWSPEEVSQARRVLFGDMQK